MSWGLLKVNKILYRESLKRLLLFFLTSSHIVKFKAQSDINITTCDVVIFISVSHASEVFPARSLSPL